MTTVLTSQVVNTIETAIVSASLNALAVSAYVLGGVIDNRPATGTTIAYDLADLTINLSSAVVAIAPAYLLVWILPTVDGTNYPTPPGGTAGAGPIYLSSSYQMIAGSNTTLVCPNIIIPPYQFKVMIQNNLGVIWPATNTSTCQMVRKTIGSW